jgi:hypothetical protein
VQSRAFYYLRETGRQPPRCATTAWQVRRERRTAAARHPYQFLELVCIEVIVSLNLDFAAQKEGGMAVSAVWTLVAFSNSLPIGIKEQTPAHRRCLRARRDALCPSAEIQKQAIGIIREDLRCVLMTKNEQFLSSNEKTAGRLFVYHINQMRLCLASFILCASHFCPRPFFAG